MFGRSEGELVSLSFHLCDSVKKKLLILSSYAERGMCLGLCV
jgi:hypothetical protein